MEVSCIKEIAIDEETMKMVKELSALRRVSVEDTIQYYCAHQIPKYETIITRDKKNFNLSTIPVKRPDIFFRYS